MSFSASVKEELGRINIFSNIEVVKAELYGYLMTVNLEEKSIKFLTENEYNINRLNKILNKLKIDYKIKMKGNSYLIEFAKKDIDLEDFDVYMSKDTEKAFVRGAFLGSGWIAEPEKRYHLEIKIKTEDRKGKNNKSYK